METARGQQAAKLVANTTTLPAAEPRDIVFELYRLTAVEAKKERPDSPFFNRTVRAKYFSKSFDLLVTES